LSLTSLRTPVPTYEMMTEDVVAVMDGRNASDAKANVCAVGA